MADGLDYGQTDLGAREVDPSPIPEYLVENCIDLLQKGELHIPFQGTLPPQHGHYEQQQEGEMAMPSDMGDYQMQPEYRGPVVVDGPWSIRKTVAKKLVQSTFEPVPQFTPPRLSREPSPQEAIQLSRKEPLVAKEFPLCCKVKYLQKSLDMPYGSIGKVVGHVGEDVACVAFSTMYGLQYHNVLSQFLAKKEEGERGVVVLTAPSATQLRNVDPEEAEVDEMAADFPVGTKVRLNKNSPNNLPESSVGYVVGYTVDGYIRVAFLTMYGIATWDIRRAGLKKMGAGSSKAVLHEPDNFGRDPRLDKMRGSYTMIGAYY